MSTAIEKGSIALGVALIGVAAIGAVVLLRRSAAARIQFIRAYAYDETSSHEYIIPAVIPLSHHVTCSYTIFNVSDEPVDVAGYIEVMDRDDVVRSSYQSPSSTLMSGYFKTYSTGSIVLDMGGIWEVYGRVECGATIEKTWAFLVKDILPPEMT